MSSCASEDRAVLEMMRCFVELNRPSKSLWETHVAQRAVGAVEAALCVCSTGTGRARRVQKSQWGGVNTVFMRVKRHQIALSCWLLQLLASMTTFIVFCCVCVL